MKRIFTHYGIYWSFLLLWPAVMTASHGTGASITYECLGQDIYKFRLTIYRDCRGSTVFPSQQLLLSSDSCGIAPIPIQANLVSSQDIAWIADSSLKTPFSIIASVKDNGCPLYLKTAQAITMSLGPLCPVATCDPGFPPIYLGLQVQNGTYFPGSGRINACEGDSITLVLPFLDTLGSDSVWVDSLVAPFVTQPTVEVNGDSIRILLKTRVDSPMQFFAPITVWVRNTRCDTSFLQSLFYLWEPDTSCVQLIGQAPTCGANGRIEAMVQAGYPPYRYRWNTGDTSRILQGIDPGRYQVAITDSTGYTWQRSIELADLRLTTTQIVSNPSCDSADGQITLLPSQGTAPFQVLWQQGDTSLQLRTLLAGSYPYTVTDSTGCTLQDTVDLRRPDSCLVRIGGTVFDDINQNCRLDSSDWLFERVAVRLNNTHLTFTDLTGSYHFDVASDSIYHIKIEPVFSVSITYIFPCPTQAMRTIYIPPGGPDIDTLDAGLVGLVGVRNIDPSHHTPFHIGPNPTQGTFTIQGLKGTATIELYTLSGQLLQTIHTHDPEIEVSLSHYVRGPFLLSIRDEQAHVRHLMFKSP